MNSLNEFNFWVCGDLGCEWQKVMLTSTILWTFFFSSIKASICTKTGKIPKRKTLIYIHTTNLNFLSCHFKLDNQDPHFHFIGFPSLKNKREHQDL